MKMSKFKWSVLVLILLLVFVVGCESVVKVKLVTKETTPTLSKPIETAPRPTSTNVTATPTNTPVIQPSNTPVVHSAASTQEVSAKLQDLYNEAGLELLVWYDFEEDSLATGKIIDRSGNGYDARLVGNVTTTQGVFDGQAISLSGNNYIQAENNPVTGRQQASFSIWFRTNHPEANYALASAAWWKGDSGSGWLLTTRKPKFWGEDDYPLYNFDVSSVNDKNHFPGGKWVHKVVTYDGDRIKEYTNGQIVNDWPTTDAGIGIGKPMTVGAWPPFFTYNFKGSIDEFQIFERALTAEEIQTIYKVEKGTSLPPTLLPEPMSISRALHTATLLQGGRVLLVGGYTGTDTANVEIFDPASGTYQATGSLNTARYGHSATLLTDGHVLVIGGYHDGWLSSAEIYDPATGQWSATQPIFAHGLNHTATLLKDGRVLVMAGDIQSGYSGADDRVEIFDPQKNSWQKAAFHEHTIGCHTATLLMDGRVLIAGGEGYPAIYDPINDTWQPAGTLTFGRNLARAVLLQDGRVLLIGGTDQLAKPTNSVEIYDPVSNTWQQAAPLQQARYDHTATLLPSGRVLVAGGAKLWQDEWGNSDAFLNSIEIYNPASNSWSVWLPLQEHRMGHTATLLPDGRILMTGGIISLGTSLDSAEILKVDDGF
jgi:hypothetical protein